MQQTRAARVSLTTGPVSLKTTSSGLELEASPGMVRKMGLFLLVFGLLAGAACLVEIRMAGSVHFLLAALAGVSLAFGPVWAIFATPLARRRGVVFDTRLGVVRKAAGNKTVLFRGISGVRAAPSAVSSRAVQLQLVLRSGEVWQLHAVSTIDQNGLRVVHAMADEIARATGIPRA